MFLVVALAWSIWQIAPPSVDGRIKHHHRLGDAFHGRASCGERLRMASARSLKTATFVAGLTLRGMNAPVVLSSIARVCRPNRSGQTYVQGRAFADCLRESERRVRAGRRLAAISRPRSAPAILDPKRIAGLAPPGIVLTPAQGCSIRIKLWSRTDAREW